MRILPIVEGDGDMQAVPALVRRIANDAARFDVEVLRPHKRGDLPKVRARFGDYFQTALLEQAPILWTLDYDCADCDDLERDMQDLQARAARYNPQVPVQFTFFVKEYESLFLADWDCVRAAFKDIPDGQSAPPDPEAVRDAKGWISKARPKGLAYKETTHQASLSAQLNLARLRERSPSFRRFEAAVLTLLAKPPQESAP